MLPLMLLSPRVISQPANSDTLATAADVRLIVSLYFSLISNAAYGGRYHHQFQPQSTVRWIPHLQAGPTHTQAHPDRIHQVRVRLPSWLAVLLSFAHLLLRPVCCHVSGKIPELRASTVLLSAESGQTHCSCEGQLVHQHAHTWGTYLGKGTQQLAMPWQACESV